MQWRTKNANHWLDTKTEEVWWLFVGSNRRETRAETVVRMHNGGNHILHIRCAMNLLGRTTAPATLCCPVGEYGARHAQSLVVENIVRQDLDTRSRGTDLGGVPIGVAAESRTGCHYGWTQDSIRSGTALDMFSVEGSKAGFTLW